MIAQREFDTQPPVQSEIKQISGSPEGVLYGVFGLLVTDNQGNLYVKQSDVSLNTGWSLVATVQT